MAIADEPLELDIRNLVWKQIITVPTDYLWNVGYESTVTNMETVRNFEVMTDKFKVDRICILGSLQRWNGAATTI